MTFYYYYYYYTDINMDIEQPTPGQDEVGEKPTAETAGLAVTARDAESAEAENHRVWSDTMDKIVESGESQGDYFMKIGEKPAEEGAADERMIVLRTPVSTRENDPQGQYNKGFVLFTKDGPFAYTYLPGANGGEFEFTKRMRELAQGGINEGHFVNNVHNGKAEIQTAGYGSHENAKNFLLRPVSNPDLITEAIQASIKEAESPHKARVEAAKTSADLAKSVGSFVTALPPRA